MQKLRHFGAIELLMGCRYPSEWNKSSISELRARLGFTPQWHGLAVDRACLDLHRHFSIL